MIRVGQLNEVSQLLSQPEYAPLRPVLLLLGWDIFIAEGSGKELTEALWPSQARTETLILHVFLYVYILMHNSSGISVPAIALRGLLSSGIPSGAGPVVSG